MPVANPQALEFLLTRRSRPSKTLRAPAPDAEQLKVLLTAAARTPDHGKLEPWRFIVLQGDALQRMGKAAEACGARLGKDAEACAKAANAFATSPLCVAVIEVQKPSEKVPPVEQTYSAGAVCLALLNAALADGWGANWLSGWTSHDRGFITENLGLADNETVAGFIHIGTEGKAPPERPRPDLDAITTWVSE
ncbi:nitroreductase family protein [Tropicibacter naphthalenivorans]|uniref:Putative NAD(P)H nitroreductase n=1 Tax=Tropicibacter naphthalenivorans TaxID=441103 RepID=A0A0P1FZ75_9RHOB|nr:nitroreductase family protein [Tropicibacter naphthalenivorans]CUH74694.1 Putative NAD(P)H nitroreductase YdjA [Tropicibacter naphthalenivorans]SMC49804.1 Nitroreductase [Tropicibacter naphthalenivorans]